MSSSVSFSLMHAYLHASSGLAEVKGDKVGHTIYPYPISSAAPIKSITYLLHVYYHSISRGPRLAYILFLRSPAVKPSSFLQASIS